jgi:hypothetical protein
MSRRMHYSRRDFLKASAATASVAALAPGAYARIRGANERIHFAVIGLGVMGSGHLRGLKRQQESLNLTRLRLRPTRCKEGSSRADAGYACASPL